MKLSAHQFNREFGMLVQRERGITREVVEMIAFCVKHSHYAELGHASVASWLIDEHGYPKSCAYRRIAAAKLVTSVPTSMQKLEEGSVNLSTLATLQQAIRSEERRTSSSIPQSRREALLGLIESKTEEQTERLIAVEFPELVKDKIEYVKPVSATETRINMVFSEDEIAILQRVKEVTAHSHFNAKWSELAILCAKEFLKHHDPLLKAARAQKRKEHRDPKSPGAGLAARVTPALRSRTLYRDAGACGYVDPVTGRRCGSRDRVEVDHILPKALGGCDDPSNLRTFCRTHNLLMARKAFGSTYIDKRIRENQIGLSIPVG